MAGELNSVADKSPEVKEMCEWWDLIAALLGGTSEMRKAGGKYLPRWPNEEVETYDARVKSSTLFPSLKRTVSTLAAKPFTKPLVYEDDVPAELKSLLEEDCDTEGRDLHTLTSEFLQFIVGFGLGGILVDYPKAPVATEGPPRTQAEEAALALRPYMVQVRAQQLLGWRTERIGDSTTLTMLRFMECVTVPDGPFNTQNIDQVRLLTPGAWEVYRQSKVADSTELEWTLFDSGTTTLKYIPFAPAYGERLGFMWAKPPLLELAWMNVEHWQSASDQRNILHVARVPILVATGISDPLFKVEIGAQNCVKLPDETADLKYVEHTGSAIGAGAEDLKDLEERMRQAGAELLIPRPAQTTKFQVQSENAVGASLLQMITAGVQDAVNLALDFMAEYMGKGKGAGGHIKLFNDYAAFNLSEASVGDLLKAEAQGVLSSETVFEELQRRGLVDGTKSWDDEKERLDAQGPPLGTLGPDGLPIVAPPTKPGVKPPTPTKAPTKTPAKV